MKFTAQRLLVAGAIGLAAIATPISLSVLSGATSAPAASSSTPTPDKIVYGEGKGSSSNFIEYVPGSGTPTTQSVTAGGGCSSPTIHGTPLLNLSALLYSPTYVGGTTSPAVVGAFQGRTGVCALTPDWAINNGGASGAEGLDFGVGSNGLVAGRVFADALINLTAESGPSGPIAVELVESDSGTQVATQTCTISGLGTTIAADSSVPNNGPCSNTAGTAGDLFDTVEVRVLTPNSEVAVVGPTSTFTLANQICAPNQISTVNGAISATLQLQLGCKSYASFSASIDPGGTQMLSFPAFSQGNNVQFTTTIAWAPQTKCQPDDSAGLPNQCAPTQVSYTGSNGFVNQTYCQAASAAQPMCTTSKTYNYVTVNGVTETQITETWSALVDSVWRH